MTNFDRLTKQELPPYYDIIEKITPKWFDFLEWLVVLSAMRFIFEKTGNSLLKGLYYLSFLFLLLYIQCFTYRIYASGITYIKSKIIKFILSLVFALLLTIIISFAIINIINGMKAFV